MKPKKSLVFLFLLVSFTTSLFTFMYTSSVNHELTELRQYLEIASVAIDSEKVIAVNKRIVAKEPRLNILYTKEYMDLVSVLRKLTDSIPTDVLWTYLIYPANNREVDSIAGATWKEAPSTLGKTWTILSVLTVDPNPKDPSSLPGVIFDASPFPAMVSIIRGIEPITISEIVEDKVYKTWNRAGFIKIFDKNGSFIAVLAVELTLKHEINLILNTLILATMYGLVISLFLTLVWVRYQSSKEPITKENNGNEG